MSQVGYLPELYEDARAEKYKILIFCRHVRNFYCMTQVLAPGRYIRSVKIISLT